MCLCARYALAHGPQKPQTARPDTPPHPQHHGLVGRHELPHEVSVRQLACFPNGKLTVAGSGARWGLGGWARFRTPFITTAMATELSQLLDCHLSPTQQWVGLQEGEQGTSGKLCTRTWLRFSLTHCDVVTSMHSVWSPASALDTMCKWDAVSLKQYDVYR